MIYSIGGYTQFLVLTLQPTITVVFILNNMFSTINVTQYKFTQHTQWSSGKTLDCSVLGPSIEAHRGLVFITTTTAIYSLGHGLCTLTAVPRSTQPSTFRETVK